MNGTKKSLKMYREDLVTAIRKVAEGAQYAFISGSEASFASRAGNLPAVWLQPIKMVKITGRSEVYAVYKATMSLQSPMLKSKMEDEMWHTLESDAVAMCRALREDEHILHVRNIKCVPNKLSMTKSGDVGVTVDFDVEMFYVI